MANKERLKQLIYGAELRCLAIINNGIVHKTPKQTVLKEVEKELKTTQNRLSLSVLEVNMLRLRMHNLYSSVAKETAVTLRKIDRKFGKKEDYEDNLQQRRDALYGATKKHLLELERTKNDVANRKEFDAKHGYIYGEAGTGILKTARSKANRGQYSPFFLCSTHLNPAEDHKDWEGLVYYDEDWERFIFDDATRAEIESYIDENDLRSVQWVTGEPVYLITRPNCKHYFQNVPITSVLNSSNEELLKAYKMYMPDEKNLSYEKTVYKGYYERLKALQYLDKICPSTALKDDIRRTRHLVHIWARKAKNKK